MSKRCWCAVVEENEHLTANRSFEAAGRKIQHGRDLLSCQVKPFHDFFYRGACFEILKDDGDGHAGAFEKPRAAYFSRDAFHRRASRPIQRRHGTALLSISLYRFGVSARKRGIFCGFGGSCTATVVLG